MLAFATGGLHAEEIQTADTKEQNSTEATLKAVKVQAAADKETATGPVPGYIAKRSATGTKTDTPIIETPQSISVVTADRIKAIGATNTREALAYTPGINIAPYGADSRYDNWIVIRGMDGYSPGYFLDGLPLRNASYYATWQTENYGTERIEVLRGPASVLYGQNPPGGLVNIVSKKPLEEPLHEVQVQFGNNERKQIAGDFSGPLDDEGTLLYRVTGLARDAKLPFADMPDDRVYIAPALTWQPSPDTSLTVLAHYLKVDAGIVYRAWPLLGTLVPTPSGEKLPVSHFIDDPDFNRRELKQWNVGYEFEHRLDDIWTLRQNARIGQSKGHIRQTWQTGDFVTVNPDNSADPANYRSVNRVVFDSNNQADSFVIDNQAQATLQLGSWQHTALFGLDYQNSKFDEPAYFGGDAGAIDVYNPTYGNTITYPDQLWIDYNIKLKQTGLYLQDQIKFGGNWVATLGGRYDWSDTDFSDRATGTTSQFKDHKFTGRAGVVYLTAGGWAPYVNYSGSFTPTATIDPTTGEAFKSETGRQYEAGVRYQPPGRKESYSMAVFDLKRQNYITYDQNYNPHQAGEVTVRGVELEALVEPVPNLNMTAAYSWTPKADITASSNPDEIGKQLNPVPENQLSLWADYRFWRGLKVGMGARYVDSNKGYLEAAPRDVPSYTLIDAMIGYDFGPWELALNARNLTDKTYITSCSGNLCYLGDQRKVIGTVSYRW